MRAQIYLKDDIVIREGEVSREMSFLNSGAVQVSRRHLSTGSYVPCMPCTLVTTAL